MNILHSTPFTTYSDIAQSHQLLAQEMPIYRVAKKFNVSEMTIRNWKDVKVPDAGSLPDCIRSGDAFVPRWTPRGGKRTMCWVWGMSGELLKLRMEPYKDPVHFFVHLSNLAQDFKILAPNPVGSVL